MATQPYNENDPSTWEVSSTPAYDENDPSTWEVSGPEEAPIQRSTWEKSKDSYKLAAQKGFIGWAARNLADATDMGKDQLRKKYPHLNEEQLETLSERFAAQAQKNIITDLEAKNAADPAEGFWENAATFGAAIPGTASPSWLLAPGAGLIQRAAWQAPIAGAESGLLQSDRINTETADGGRIQDHYDVEELGYDIAGAVAGQAGMELLGKGLGKAYSKVFGKENMPDDPLAIHTPSNRMTAENENTYRDMLKNGASFEEIEAFLDQAGKFKFGMTKKAFEAWDKAGRPNAAVRYLKTDHTKAESPSVNYARPSMPEVQDIVGEATKDWKNAPDITFVTRDTQIKDKNLKASIRKAQRETGNRVIGVYGEDGKVTIIQENVRSADELKAALFHETLGHAGLAYKFRDDLDNFLEDLYANSGGDFAGLVDMWKSNNPKAYAGDPRAHARAIEEVLAEMSQGGKIDPSMWQKIVHYVKQWARDKGIKNFNFSDAEVRTILGIAHAEVTGKGTKFDPSGNRFMYIGRVGDDSIHRENYPDDPSVQAGLGSDEYYEAVTALEAGQDPDQVRFDTGWFKGMDGKMRRELDDSDSDIIAYPELDAAEGMPLGDILDHPELFKAYPDLKKVPVFVRSNSATNGWAYYMPGKNEHIVLSEGATKDRTTLLHEIQHAVQEREDFAKGGNVDQVLSEISEEELSNLVQSEVLSPLEKELDKAYSIKSNAEILADDDLFVNSYKRWLKNPYNEAELSAALDDLAKVREETGIESDEFDELLTAIFEQVEAKKLNEGTPEYNKDIDSNMRMYITKAGLKASRETRVISARLHRAQMALVSSSRSFKEGFFKDKIGHEAYMRLAGEIEARDTAWRANLDKSARDAITPYVSQNIPKENAIVRFMTGADDADIEIDDFGDVVSSKKPTTLDIGFTLRGLDDALLQAQDARGEKEVVSLEETLYKAKQMGLNASKLKKQKSLSDQGLAARIAAGEKLVAEKLDNISKLNERIETKGYTYELHQRYLRELAEMEAIYARIEGDRAEVGRALNVLKQLSQPSMRSDHLQKLIAENVKNDVLTDPAKFEQLVEQVKAMMQKGNTRGAVKMARTAFRPKAGDYIFSLWYNALLSNPATHFANIAGTGLNFAVDLIEKGGAAVIGQHRSLGATANDRVMASEVVARLWGAGKAILDIENFKAAGKAFTSDGSQAPAGADKAGSTSLVMPGKSSYVLEAATRGLMSQDEWFKNVIQLSNVYGMAARNARQGKGDVFTKDYWKRVSDIVDNPGDRILQDSADYAKVLQFLDKPSDLATSIKQLQRTKPTDAWLTKVGRNTLRLLIPFVNTPDALIRTAIRRAGPLGVLERETIKGMKSSSKAEQDIVKSRMIVGSTMIAGVALAAANGDITGNGVSDWRKREAIGATRPPNSIKIGDEWYPYTGLEPVSTTLSAVATAVERYQNGEYDEEAYFGSVGSILLGTAASLAETAYTEILSEVFKAAESGDWSNIAAGIAASTTTPGFVRAYTQETDRAVRDTRGDKSFEDRVAGRVASGWPGSSELLPQKHDVYGRPISRTDALGPDILDWMTNRFRPRPEETDPTILELSRLEKNSKGTMLGRPSEKIGGKKLTAEEFQEYQRTSGEYIVDVVSQFMESGQWQEMNDKEQIALVKKIAKKMRKKAQEELFPETVEEDEEE